MGKRALAAFAAALCLMPLHASTALALPPAAVPAGQGGPAEEDDPTAPAAAGEQAVSADGARRIEVWIAADAAERDALARVLHELMQRLSVEVEVEAVERVERRDVLARVPPGSPYLARCFIDLRAEGRALLYVHDPARDRVLERRIERSPGDAELAREELGHMLLASIEALLAGATLGAPRDELAVAEAHPPPPAAADTAPAQELPAAAPPALGSWALRGALLYEVAALGHGPGVTHGPMLAAIIRAPLRQPELGLLLSAQYRLPLHVDAEPVGMHLTAFGLRALATFESALSARVALRVGLGGGADVTRLAPATTAGARIDLTEARTLTLGVTRGLLGVDIRATPVLALWAALAVDVDLDRAQYVLVQQNGMQAEVSAPWRVRPSLSLGVVLP